MLHKFIGNISVVRQEVEPESEDIRSSFIKRMLGVTWCLEYDTLQFKILFLCVERNSYL